MLAKSEPACFVIADISGYTGFLASVEIEHAQDIVADFMGTVVKSLRPPFKLAKFEGDAAFLYAAGETPDGSLIQDTIEQAYFKFCRRRRDVVQASSCTCKACAKMGDLDFKFVVHHGDMVKQKMGGREELAGRDVILVHRLLKNGVAEKLGGHAYALYSDTALRAMGIDPSANGLMAHGETIDVIGEVALWAKDLEAAWEKENERRRVEVTKAEAYLTLAFDFAARARRYGSISRCRACGSNGGRPMRSSSARARGGAGSAPRTIACMASTRSSRSSSIGGPSTTSPSAFSCRRRGRPRS